MAGDGSDLLARTAENVPDANVHFQLHQSDQIAAFAYPRGTV
jgi:hypothetical protein